MSGVRVLDEVAPTSQTIQKPNPNEQRHQVKLLADTLRIKPHCELALAVGSKLSLGLLLEGPSGVPNHAAVSQAVSELS